MFYRYTTKCIIAKNFPLPTLQTLQKNKWHESPWSLIGLIDKYWRSICIFYDIIIQYFLLNAKLVPKLANYSLKAEKSLFHDRIIIFRKKKGFCRIWIFQRFGTKFRSMCNGRYFLLGFCLRNATNATKSHNPAMSCKISVS